jgi:hypothetical protein
LEGERPGLVLVDVTERCIQPKVNEASKTFEAGLFSGVVALVDLDAGKVLCHARYTATNSAVAEGRLDYGAQGVGGGDRSSRWTSNASPPSIASPASSRPP